MLFADTDRLVGRPRMKHSFEARLFVEVVSEVVEKQFYFSLVFVVLSYELFPFLDRQDVGRE